MKIQTTIDLDHLRELAQDPATATDAQIIAAASLVPGTSIHFGQPSPELDELTLSDVALIGAVFDQAVRRGLSIQPPNQEV